MVYGKIIIQDCAIIENKFRNISKLTKNGLFQMNINGTQYTIDLFQNAQINGITQKDVIFEDLILKKQNMVQIVNMDTANTHMLPRGGGRGRGGSHGYGRGRGGANGSRHPSGGSSYYNKFKVQWQWKDDHNKWHNFDNSTNTFVENNRLSKNQNVFLCKITNKDYIINLNKMTQENTQTGFQRQIRYIS